MKTDLNEQILALASQWENVQAAQERLNIVRGHVAGMIAALVRKHGATPPRATRLRVLRAEDGTELRVTTSQDLRVDGSLALRLRAVLRQAGLGRWFRRIFRRVESFVLAEGAHDLIAMLSHPNPPFTDVGKGVIGQIRRLFLAAVEEKDQSPSIDVRRPETKERSRGESAA